MIADSSTPDAMPSLADSSCIVCKGPAVDGAIQAVHLDRSKLQIWFVKVEGRLLAEQIEDTDLVCYFCVWHAECFAELFFGLEGLHWWPKDLRYLDQAGFSLRKSFLDGDFVDLCSDDETEEPEASPQGEAKQSECFYCGVSVARPHSHIRVEHKDAIRCDYCATFFHTLEEKQEHTKKMHETARKNCKRNKC